MTLSTLTRIIVAYTNAAEEYAKSTDFRIDGDYALSPPTNITDALENIHQDTENIILIFCQCPQDGNIWQRVINDLKSKTPFAEAIYIRVNIANATSRETLHANGIATSVLQGGFCAYFEPVSKRLFERDILSGYIDAAHQRIVKRRKRYESSEYLTESTKTVSACAEEILEQLKTLTQYDRASVFLLSERDYITDQNGERTDRLIRKRVVIDRPNDAGPIDWHLLRPVKDDELVSKILSGSIKRKLFSDPANDPEIKDLWDSNKLSEVRSWIALPLTYLEEPIGLITLDATGDNRFGYPQISETGLSQFANQAAIALASAQQYEAATGLGDALEAVAEQKTLKTTLNVIAREACQLVGGVFSYVVIPNTAETVLEFVSAWSEEEEYNYLEVLKNEVKKFYIYEPSKNYRRKEGITVRSYLNASETGDHSTPPLDDCKNEFKGSLRQYLPQLYDSFMNFHHDLDEKSTQIISGSNIAISIIDRTPNASGHRRVLGVINVEHEDPCAFTSQHIETIERFADFAAIAIKKHYAQELIEDLFQASNEATAIVDSKYILKGLANKTQEAAGADKGVKIFIDIDNITYAEEVSDDVEDTPEGRRTRGGEGHTYWAISNNKQIVIDNIEDYEIEKDPVKRQQKYPDYHDKVINPATRDAGHKAVVCLPLRISKTSNPNHPEVIGAMWLHYSTKQQFTEDEINKLQLYADRVAVVYYNDIERKLLSINKRLGRRDITSKKASEELVEYVRDRFEARGVMFYADRGNGYVERFAASKEMEKFAAKKKDIGKPFMSLGETFSYEYETNEKTGEVKRRIEGLVGHLFAGVEKDGIDYRDQIHLVPNYLNYKHRVQADADTGKLHSLLAIRLEAPLTGKRIGVLVVVGKEGRDYSERTGTELEQFANLASNLLALMKFEAIEPPPPKPPWKTWIARLITFVIIALYIVAPYIYSQGETDTLIKIGLIIGQILIFAFVSDEARNLVTIIQKRISSRS